MVSGTVTDINGSAVVGAAVSGGGKSTTSTQFGNYLLPVTVAAQTPSLVTTVSASATIGGKVWTGQNTVEVLSGEANTRNVHIVISDASTQGQIVGSVLDAQGSPLNGARVFAGSPDGQGGFGNLASIVAFAGAGGAYTLAKLPPGTYAVTASYAGHLNQTVNVTVTANGQTTQNFALLASTSSAALAAPSDFTATCFTTPTVASRAAARGSLGSAMEAIKQLVLSRKGLRGRAADPTHITQAPLRRDTPAGSIIESDLFWAYNAATNLYGYDIVRSLNDDTHFVSIATPRDPMADRFSDVDPALTPDQAVYYSVAELDTINFPLGNGKGEGLPSPEKVVRPLTPISLTGPTLGQKVSATPILTWTAVNRAVTYQVLVYAQFPTFQSDTDPNGTRPIWPADLTNPGASAVAAPATSLVYQGPALTSGQTYYWAVLAQDAVGSAFSISPIRSFTVQ